MTGGGVCFGLGPKSTIDLRFLRSGAGTEIDVREGLVEPVSDGRRPTVEWLPRPGNQHHARLYSEGDGRYRLWVDQVGWYEVDVARRSVVVPLDAEPVSREQRLWGVPVILLRSGTGEVPLHASAVEVDGSALVFVAPGRFGKTTLAAGFHAAGHRLLTEDLAMLTSDAAPYVVPGPPTLRLRPDVEAGVPLEDVTVLRRDPDRTYLLVDERRRGAGTPVPVAGIVFLHASDSGQHLSRVTATERLPELWSTSFSFEEDRGGLFQRLASIAQSVPLWDLRRARTFESLPQVVGLLADRCVRGQG